MLSAYMQDKLFSMSNEELNGLVNDVIEELKRRTNITNNPLRDYYDHLQRTKQGVNFLLAFQDGKRYIILKKDDALFIGEWTYLTPGGDIVLGELSECTEDDRKAYNNARLPHLKLGDYQGDLIYKAPSIK